MEAVTCTISYYLATSKNWVAYGLKIKCGICINCKVPDSIDNETISMKLEQNCKM